MAHIFFQLGTNAELSLAEIHSVFHTETEVLSGNAFTSLPQQKVRKLFPELGGVMRSGIVLGEEADFNGVAERVVEYCKKKSTPGKKMKIAFHFSNKNGWKKHGIDLQKKLKTAVKEEDFSVRIVNRGPQNLDSYAVPKEKVLEKGNAEFYFISMQNGWAWGVTKNIQKAYEFANRDMKKPVRDMKVGLMPPKLARMMINLSRDENGQLPDKIYDPFCGMGTVLLEGLDLGLKIAGSDLSRKMVEATKKNTTWYYDSQQDFSAGGVLGDDNRQPFFLRDIFVKDATKDFYPDEKKKVNNSTIVAEGFLGKIFHRPVSEGAFLDQKENLFPLYRQFLFQVSKEKIDNIVFGFPFWKAKDEQQKYFSFVDELVLFAKKLGFQQENSSLRYIREGQAVGREIVVLRRK